MGALIGITSKVSNSLPNDLKNNSYKELINLLKEKIEESIMEDKKIVIDVLTPLINCRNTLSVEDYEINEEYLYLNYGNFELHINLNEIEIKYDDIIDESFILTCNNSSVVLHILE